MTEIEKIERIREEIPCQLSDCVQALTEAKRLIGIIAVEGWEEDKELSGNIAEAEIEQAIYMLSGRNHNGTVVDGVAMSPIAMAIIKLSRVFYKNQNKLSA